MHVDIVLFDLDGTLVDSKEDIYNHLCATLRHFSKPIPEKDYVISLIGSGARGLLANFFNQDELEDALSFFRTIYHQNPAKFSKPFPEITQTLETLLLKGFLLGVLTNKQEALARKILDKLGLDAFFVCVVGSDTFGKRKPSPESLIYTLRMLNTSTERAILVGDTENDRACAQNAGAKFGYAKWGYGKLESPISIQTPLGLLEFLGL
ncbi:MAG: HAD-IA family hydrolase [Aquificaceae bacterium]|nr:HAD-IA family hydrolase [Aquificaceae bacterium]